MVIKVTLLHILLGTGPLLGKNQTKMVVLTQLLPTTIILMKPRMINPEVVMSHLKISTILNSKFVSVMVGERVVVLRFTRVTLNYKGC